jgi:hypothetical protein
VSRAWIRYVPSHLLRIGLLVATLAPVAACGSDELPASGEIVYSSTPEGIVQLDVMDADGGKLRVLTDQAGLGGASSPDWAPVREKE